MSALKRVALADAGILRNGVNFNQGQEGAGLPVIKVKDFQNRTLAPMEGLDELNPAAISISELMLIQPGDTLIIRSNGNGDLVGRCLYVSEVNRPTTFSGFCIRFRPNPVVLHPKYATYLLRSSICRDKWVAFGSGTGIQNINQDVIGDTEIEVPGMDVQVAISEILGALDDKIELNRKMNRTLEELAQGMFRSWFVEFDPVVAKREGRRPVGVPDAVLPLFPEHFDDSELGPIPQGWSVEPLDAIASFLNGLALQKFPPGSTATLPVIKIAELRAESTTGADRCGINVPKDYIIEDGDVLFSWSGTLHADIWCGGRGALNQHLFKVTSSRFPKWFYFQWVLEHLPEFQAIAADKATTMGHIRRHHLSDAKVVVPSEKVLWAMDSIQAPLLDQILVNRIENCTLAGLRDTLLDPLLSGELSLKEAERAVAKVL